MNRYAYLASGHVIALMEALSKAKVNIHGRENIPDGSLIFVVNHFTRIETFLLPYHIYHLTNRPVWSLANSNMFSGAFGQMLEAVGAVSTKAPHRDRVIVKSLLTGEANWIIFPEGCMVKDKVIVEHARYVVSCAGGSGSPHTGAATLALRTEFYRRRLRRLSNELPDEAERLMQLFVRRVGVVGDVDGDRHALLHAQQRSRRGAVIADGTKNAIGREFNGDRRDFKRELRLATSCEPVGARNDCVCWPTSLPPAAATPAILRKSRLSMRNVA